MIKDKEILPDDPQLLKNIIFKMQKKHDEQKLKYQFLEEKYLLLRDKFFKRSSEKTSKYEQNQMLLFNEAETEFKEPEPEDEIKTETTVKTYTRKKRGRKKLPEDLPREEIIYDLSDEEKVCPCCGKERPQIGKEDTEELDIIPAKVKVLKHVRIKYGPCKCDDFLEEEIPEIKTAILPARLIPGSIASPGLLAYVATSKYVDSLPFYRQSKIFERIDVDISRATLCNWIISAAKKCEPLIELMRKEIRSGPLIQMDETTLQVLKEEGRAPTTKSYMWISVGYPACEKPVIMFDYHQSRSKDIPLAKLEGYNGYLQTDGYSGYNAAGAQDGIIHVGCFAHARRYFTEAAKLSKKKINTGGKGLIFIQKIYKIEKTLREQNLSANDFLSTRKKEVKPVLDNFYEWLQNVSVPPQSKAGKAVSYALNEWNKLSKYIDHPFLTPDNNRAENTIRPFVVGRKNWLFSNTPKGANSSAILYSLVETAKANKLEPYKYLRYLFAKLPEASTEEDLRQLLPTNVLKEQIDSI
jgi:transposase